MNMRKFCVLIFLLLIPALCYAQPTITFGEVEHDFGTVPQGDSLEHVFEFTNTGDQELVIERVTSS